MVHLTEVRIVMPFTTEEFKRGQRYANWKTNENATEPGQQGGQLLSSTPYFHEVYGEGMFTHSLFRLGNRLPDWVNRLVPPSALVIDEKSWITFPYMRTVITIPFFSRLKMEIESVHINDDGSTENALGLSAEDLAIRKVDFMDLGSEKVAPRDYQKELDPVLVKPKTTGRGPLTPGWQKREKILMCAYKVIKAEANYWGVATRAEKLLINSIRQIFLLAHKNCFGLTDEWYHLSYEEVMALEVASHERLNLAKATVLGHEPEAGEMVEKLEETGGKGAIEAEEGTGKGDGGGETGEGGGGEGEGVLGAETADGTVKKEKEQKEEGKEGEGEDEMSDLEIEFFEAEMQWSLQEELYAEELLSEGFSSKRFEPHPQLPGPQGTLPVPALCPVCGNGSTPAVGPPSLFCTTCSEFFCQRCFSKFHCTARLRNHATTPVAGAPGASAYSEGANKSSGQTGLGDGMGVEGRSDYNSGALEKESSMREKEMMERERSRLTKLRKEEERGKRDVSKQERKEREQREKEEERERKDKEKEKQREDSLMEKEMRQAKKDIIKAQKTANQRRQEGDNAEAPELERLSSLKYPPLNLDGLPLLGSQRSLSQGEIPRSESEGSGPLVAAIPPTRDQGDVGVGSDGASETSSTAKLQRGDGTPSLKLSLSEESLERLEDEFSGRPVELSEAALSLILSLYRSCGKPANGGPIPRSSSSRSLGSFSLRRGSLSSSTVDPQERPPSLASPFQGSTGDLVRIGSQPEATVQEAIHRLSMDGPPAPGQQKEEISGIRTPQGLSGSPPEGSQSSAGFVLILPEMLPEVARSTVQEQMGMLMRFRALIELLNYMEPQSLSHEEKLVFWVNIYNTLALHGYLIYGIPKSHYKRVMFLNKVSYLIGGINFSLLTIEHSVLRAASHRPALAGLLPVQKFKSSDPAKACALGRPEPLVTFALSCGSASSPPVRVYTLGNVRQQLHEATSWFLQRHVDLRSSTKISLPKLLQWYGKDFAPNTAALLEWIAMNLPEPQKGNLLGRMKRKTKKNGEETVAWQGGAKSVQVRSYDWHFSYLLGKAPDSLTSKQ